MSDVFLRRRVGIGQGGKKSNFKVENLNKHALSQVNKVNLNSDIPPTVYTLNMM